jgi:colicin import membrane protein
MEEHRWGIRARAGDQRQCRQPRGRGEDAADRAAAARARQAQGRQAAGGPVEWALRWRDDPHARRGAGAEGRQAAQGGEAEGRRAQAEKPKAEKPKAEKPKAEKPKAEKPKTAAPQHPEPAKPAPASHEPGQDQPTVPASAPAQPVAATHVSSAAPARHAVEAARARHVAPTPRPHQTTAPPDHGGARRHLDPAPAATSPKGSDAAAVQDRPIAGPTTHAPRIEPQRAAAAVAPAERPPTPRLTLVPGPTRNDPTLFLVLAFAIASAYLLGRYGRPRGSVRR